MKKEQFAARVAEILLARRQVSCRLGLIHTIVYPPYQGRNPRTGEYVPVPSKKGVRFVPSQELVRRAFGLRGVPAVDYSRRRPVDKRAVYVYDLFGSSDISDDALDEYLVQLERDRNPLEPMAHIDEGTLFEDIANALSSGSELAISGFGKLAQRTLDASVAHRLQGEMPVADAHLADLRIVYLEASPVLKLALNA